MTCAKKGPERTQISCWLDAGLVAELRKHVAEKKTKQHRIVGEALRAFLDAEAAEFASNLRRDADD